ncbi:uncharacterized protein [Argopecten irradians]
MKEAFKAGLQEARNQTGTISTGGIAANAQSGSAIPQDVGPPPMTSNTPATSNHSASAVTVEDSVGRAIQDTAALCGQTSNNSPQSSEACSLIPTLTSLVHASLTPASRKLYNKALQSISDFCRVYLGIPLQFPVPYTIVALYVAYAYKNGKAHSTILSQLSALAFVHKVNNMYDPTKVFLVRKAVNGVARLAPSFDTRLPITQPILHRLCRCLPHMVTGSYDNLMFRAIFTTAFYALARIGELLAFTKPQSERVLQLEDVSFEVKNDQAVKVHLVFKNFKHNISQQPHSVPIVALPRHPFCPVQALHAYVKQRGASSGCLFIDKLSNPLSRRRFESLVHDCLLTCGLDASRYKGHSFRIGGASHASSTCNFSDSQLRTLGRWKTDAFKKYIRSPALSDMNVS